jgi:hypothetical protein
MTAMKRFLLVACLLLVPSSPRAGECVDGEDEYVAALERGPGSEGFDYAISCLGFNPIVDGHRWAGPIAAAAFAELRADTLKTRIAKVLATLRTTTWADSADHQVGLYSVAARRGIARIDSVDVFRALLKSRTDLDTWDGLRVYEGLAVLEDCRAVDFLRERYRELRRDAGRGYPDEILDVASCLYHIPCREAVRTAQELAATEHDERLRERLRRIATR